jgi:hypothetical protein
MRRLAVPSILVLFPALAVAFPLDEARRFSLRGRFYTEASIATEYNEPQTTPSIAPGQLLSNRSFFNPELDGDLTTLQPFGLDTLKFRLALWGFYDGIYDYGAGQYARAKDSLQARFTEGRTSSAPFTRRDDTIDPYEIYAYQRDPVFGALPFRVNEAYVHLEKGRVSLRAGRQSISWGESDTVALLDQSNPFDLTRGIPGLFEDVDEARIPLWTLRGTVDLAQSWGPLSSVFLDAYLVPGSIDTTVSATPIPTVSPYAPPEDDPQNIVTTFTSIVPADLRTFLEDSLGGIQFVQYDHLPTRSMANSRWGVRLEGVVAREYTTSLWYYRTLAQTPVPQFAPLDLSRAPLFHEGATGPTQLITTIEHRPVDVFAAATTFFSPRLNAILRGQVMFFLDEQAFIPDENLPFEALVRQPRLRRFLAELPPALGGPVLLSDGADQGHVPTADFLRWELGFDRNFFVRALNPANSFLFVGAFVGSWNLSETFTGRDYRYYGQRKPTSTGLETGANVDDLPDSLQAVAVLRTVPDHFVDLHPVETFVQANLRTDYLHGRLTPQLTVILNPRGTYAVAPAVTYRWSDSVQVDLRYVALMGGFFQTGFFRDRDQVTARLTYLVN